MYMILSFHFPLTIDKVCVCYFGNLPLWIHAFHPLLLQDINEIDLPYGDLQLSLDAVTRLANNEEIIKAVLGDNITGLLGI